MSELFELIRTGASTEAIKANLHENKHNKDYVNLVDEYGTSALMYACGDGYTEAVKLLLEANADVNIANKFGDTALMCACLFNRIEIVKLLLEANADIDIIGEYGRSALMWAGLYKHTEIIELLNNCNNYVIFNGEKYKLVEDRK